MTTEVDEEETDSVEQICLRCGGVNDERASRCGSCRAPLDDFAASSPWEMGKVAGGGYSEPVSPRTKPVIFYGVWVYFGPTGLFSLWAIFETLRGLLSGELVGNLETFLPFLLSLVYGLLSVWALWAVTKGYLGADRKDGEVEEES